MGTWDRCRNGNKLKGEFATPPFFCYKLFWKSKYLL